MVLKSLELYHFRNYDSLRLEFDERINILYGDNAQGKTNLLEAIYLSATTRSPKGAKDREMVRFGDTEAHIRTLLQKSGETHQIDIHLRTDKSKGVAVDKRRIQKASQLMGLMNVVCFSPEDLGIIKNGPSQRRRFVDMELCQVDSSYLSNLAGYNRAVKQRNQLLKEISFRRSLLDLLSVWDAQLVSFGTKVIERRKAFIDQLNEILLGVHGRLTAQKEDLHILYEPNVEADSFEEKLKESQDRDVRMKMTSAGPHRDDFSFVVKELDLRKFGSQGQQRTAALSLKLAEIEQVKEMTKDTPLLLLDDVLSELDSNRQNELLNSIGGVQTIITCTGLDDFINHRFAVDKVFRVAGGTASEAGSGL